MPALGRPFSDYRSIGIPTPETSDGRIAGEVLRVDTFGNLITNIRRRAFEVLRRGDAIRIEVGGEDIGRLVETYADIGPDEVCALFGSSDYLEFAANSASAAARLSVERGAPVIVSRP